MIWIAHRGNIEERIPERENHPEYLIEAQKKGFDIEVDIWFLHEKWFLGHDEPSYEVGEDFLDRKGCWFHAKNIDALSQLIMRKHHCFWHQEDDVTLTSQGYLWTFPGKKLVQHSIAVMPERASYTKEELASCSGICTDNIILYQQMLGL